MKVDVEYEYWLESLDEERAISESEYRELTADADFETSGFKRYDVQATIHEAQVGEEGLLGSRLVAYRDAGGGWVDVPVQFAEMSIEFADGAVADPATSFNDILSRTENRAMSSSENAIAFGKELSQSGGTSPALAGELKVKTTNEKEKIMKNPIIEARVYPIKDGANAGSLKANATVTIGGQMVVNKVKVIGSDRGPFVSMPSSKGKDEKFYPQVDTASDRMKEAFDNAVLAEYDRVIALPESERGYSYEGKTAPSQDVPDISVKIRNVLPEPKFGTVAFATVMVGDIKVYNVRVREGKNGIYSQMPSVPSGKGDDGKTKYKDVAHPITAELKKAIDEAVSAEYKDMVAERDMEPQGEIVEKDMGDPEIAEAQSADLQQQALGLDGGDAGVAAPAPQTQEGWADSIQERRNQSAAAAGPTAETDLEINKPKAGEHSRD